MPPGFSLWLDVVRSGAALTVLLGHMAHTRFTGGDYSVLREWNVASDAVIVFFVLSGVVIASATDRDGSLGQFAFKRLTRIYGVLVPALCLTMLFDGIGRSIDTQAYQPPFFEAVSAGEMILRGLSATSEWQGLWSRLRLGSNGPLWSLSYEVAFYALFGVCIFLNGALRIVLALLLLLLVGVPILALLPCWGLGVMLWSRLRLCQRIAASTSVAWVCALGGPVCAIVLKALGLPDALAALTMQAFAPFSHHQALGYSDEAVWSILLALCVTLHLWGVYCIASCRSVSEPGALARSIRWTAGASFSVYVMHYPCLHLLDAVLPRELPGHDVWMLVLTLGVCFAFAQIFERPLPRQRAVVQALWLRLMPKPGTRNPQTE